MPNRFHRGRLPHWQPDGAIIFVTFRVKGSLPKSAILSLMALQTALEANLASQNPLHQTTANAYKRLFAAYDQELSGAYKDLHNPFCILHRPENAEILTQCIWRGHDLRRFILHRYCIMPNHVHLLIEPLIKEVPDDFSMTATWPPQCLELLTPPEELSPGAQPECLALELLMGSLKAAAARRINKRSQRSGALFQKENFDHWIRNEEEYQRVIAYIDENPVEAKLCNTASDWIWGSAGEKVRG